MNDAKGNPHRGTTYIRLRCYNPYVLLLLLLSVEVKLDTEKTEIIFEHVLLIKYEPLLKYKKFIKNFENILKRFCFKTTPYISA